MTFGQETLLSYCKWVPVSFCTGNNNPFPIWELCLTPNLISQIRELAWISHYQTWQLSADLILNLGILFSQNENHDIFHIFSKFGYGKLVFWLKIYTVFSSSRKIVFCVQSFKVFALTEKNTIILIFTSGISNT